MTIRYTLTAIATGTALLLTAPVHAGGPVIVQEDPMVAEARPSSEGRWVLPVIVGLIIIGALASGGSSDVCQGPDEQPTPEPGPCQ